MVNLLNIIVVAAGVGVGGEAHRHLVLSSSEAQVTPGKRWRIDSSRQISDI